MQISILPLRESNSGGSVGVLNWDPKSLCPYSLSNLTSQKQNWKLVINPHWQEPPIEQI